jgi:hypothetical protein
VLIVAEILTRCLREFRTLIFDLISAGDQFVGRTVAGLPIDDANFAIMPPMFHGRSVMQNLLEVCFPSLPQNILHIGEFALAALIFHWEYI